MKPGTMRENQLNSTVPISKLLLCGHCQSVQYCSKECQDKRLATTQEGVQVTLTKERKAQEEATCEMRESDLQKRIYALADEYPDDIPGQAKAFIDILTNTKEGDLMAIACSYRIADDLELLNECQPGRYLLPPRSAYFVGTGSCIDSGPRFRKDSCSSLLAHGYFDSSLLSRRTGLRTSHYFGWLVFVPTTNRQRSTAYFATCWKVHLNFSIGLWNASREGSLDLYPVCKDFWRQLPICLVHESVARAIFQTDKEDLVPFSNQQSPHLKPLLGMLNLHDMADDLEGLTNQVAALLVIHARNIKDNNMISAAAELERSVTRRMICYQKMQWREMSLVVAKAMMDRKRQLTNDEFLRVVQRAQHGEGRQPKCCLGGFIFIGDTVARIMNMKEIKSISLFKSDCFGHDRS